MKMIGVLMVKNYESKKYGLVKNAKFQNPNFSCNKLDECEAHDHGKNFNEGSKSKAQNLTFPKIQKQLFSKIKTMKV